MSAITATIEKPTGKAARVRLRLLAAFLPVTAALYVGAEALDPKGTDQVVTSTATALRLLPVAAAHSSQLYLSGSLSVLALGGLAVSYAAIATLVTGRGWVIATIAALLGGLGAFAGAMFNVLVGISLAVAASAHMTPAAAARFLVTGFGSWAGSGRRVRLLRQRVRRAGRHGVRAVAQPRRAALVGRAVHRRPGGRRVDGRHRPQGRAVHAAVRRRDDPARGPDLAGRRSVRSRWPIRNKPTTRASWPVQAKESDVSTMTRHHTLARVLLFGIAKLSETD